MYNYSLVHLAQNNISCSQRELHKNLQEKIKISLPTFNDYIRYSLSAKIIKQVFEYDFKKQKFLDTKSKFYFSNLNFRNSLVNFTLSENILKENQVFLFLQSK
jgi:predicted AAA+ superfamily ATPase